MPSFTSATPCSTFSRVTQFMRPRWSSGPKSPQFDPGGLCFQRCAISVVMTTEPFGDQGWFLPALDIHRRAPGDLDAVVVNFFKPEKRKSGAHARAHGYGRGEADAVEPV